MKISQKIKQRTREDKIWWSFEYFPPRTAQVLLGGYFFSSLSMTGIFSFWVGFAKPS